MNTESSNQILASVTRDIELLKRQSRTAIPVATLGLAAIIGGLVYSAIQLQEVRSQVGEKTQELELLEKDLSKKRQEYGALIDQKAKLEQVMNELTNRVADATKTSDIVQKNAQLTDALATATVATASLSATSALLLSQEDTSRYGDYRVDLFYCEQGAQRNKPLAESALALAPDTSRSRWKVRELSISRNASPGYGIRSDLIRFNADERSVAGKLRDDITKQVGVSLSSQEIKFATPGYVSVFFCE